MPFEIHLKPKQAIEWFPATGKKRREGSRKRWRDTVIDEKKPVSSLRPTTVQKPTPAMFLCLVSLTFDLLIPK